MIYWLKSQNLQKTPVRVLAKLFQIEWAEKCYERHKNVNLLKNSYSQLSKIKHFIARNIESGINGAIIVVPDEIVTNLIDKVLRAI